MGFIRNAKLALPSTNARIRLMTHQTQILYIARILKMTETTTKRRIREAKQRASQRLADADYDIIPSTNQNICIVATRDTNTRYIRIVIDDIKPEDIELIKKIRGPQNCTKEVWCARKKGKFEIRIIN